MSTVLFRYEIFDGTTESTVSTFTLAFSTEITFLASVVSASTDVGSVIRFLAFVVPARFLASVVIIRFLAAVVSALALAFTNDINFFFSFYDDDSSAALALAAGVVIIRFLPTVVGIGFLTTVVSFFATFFATFLATFLAALLAAVIATFAFTFSDCALIGRSWCR